MSLFEQLGGQIDDRALDQMSQQLGTDRATTQRAVAAALPMLVGALARNTRDANGAQSLANALERDHDGSQLDDIHGFLGGGLAGSLGGKILGHVLGGRRQQAERNLGRTGGLDPAKASQLLAMLAPLVLAYLGRQKRQRDLSSGGLGDLLRGEATRVEQRAPTRRGGGSIFESMLDRDGDGQVADDLASAGMEIFGNLLGGRRR